MTPGDPSISVAASPDRVTIVQTVTLDVRVVAPASLGAPAFDPPLRDALGDAGWTVVSVDARPPSVGETPGELVHAFEARIEPFLAGEYDIPPLVATFEDAAAVVGEPLTVEVAAVLAEAEVASVDPSSLAEPARPEPAGAALPWVIAGAVVVLAAAAGWVRVRAGGGTRGAAFGAGEALRDLDRASDHDRAASAARRVLEGGGGPRRGINDTRRTRGGAGGGSRRRRRGARHRRFG